MDILINKFSQWLDDGEYKKILEISQLIFNLIAPSFSYIFLYERNLFRQIDILKFLILCIILNSTLMFITWILMMYRNELKNDLRDEDEKICKKQLISYTNISTQSFINSTTALIWLMYINYIVYGDNDLIWVSNCTSICVIVLFIFIIIGSIKDAIKLKKYSYIGSFIIYLFIIVNILYNILT